MSGMTYMLIMLLRPHLLFHARFHGVRDCMNYGRYMYRFVIVCCEKDVCRTVRFSDVLGIVDVVP